MLDEFADSAHERQNDLAGKNDAKDIYEHLLRQVRERQATLADDEELGVKLANYGEAAQINIRGLGYKNPNLIEFWGIDAAGRDVTLVQHISQLNFLLVATKPIDDEPYHIGF